MLQSVVAQNCWECRCQNILFENTKNQTSKEHIWHWKWRGWKIYQYTDWGTKEWRDARLRHGYWREWQEN